MLKLCTTSQGRTENSVSEILAKRELAYLRGKESAEVIRRIEMINFERKKYGFKPILSGCSI